MVSGIGSVRAAAASGDARGSKAGFVALVGSLQQWAADAGISAQLKGL